MGEEKKIVVYSVRSFDERPCFEACARELGLTLVFCPDGPTMENVSLTEGALCVDIITTRIDRELMQAFAANGVRYLVTRTIGYDHIDLEAAREFGIRVGNTPYGPCGVADYTILLLLMSIRHMKRIMERGAIQDFTLAGVQGRELKDLTVAVIGTGRIGATVLQQLKGFGCRLLAYDLYPKEEVKAYAAYRTLEEIWKEADVISLHAPLTEANFHLIDREALQKMKDGVVLINTARGALIDSEALIEALESGKVGAAGLDVIEDEFALYYFDRKSDVLSNRELALLRSFPNVTVTHHMAFYTDNYVKTVVEDSLRSCLCVMEGRENPWEVA